MYLIPFNLNLNSQMAPVATVTSHVTLDALSCSHGAQLCWLVAAPRGTEHTAWSWMDSYLEEGSPSSQSPAGTPPPQPKIPETGLVIFLKHISFKKLLLSWLCWVFVVVCGDFL